MTRQLGLGIVACALMALPVDQGALARKPPRARSPAQWLRSGHYERAERAYAAQAAKGRVQALLGLARVQLETGRYRDAIQTARRAAVGPTRARALTLAGEAHLARGERSEAVEALAAARALRPRSYRARILLALAYLEQGKQTEARALFHTFYDAYDGGLIDKASAEQLTYVAVACRHTNNFRDAADTLRKAVLLDPRHLEARVQWASISLEKYDADNAARQYREALAVNPNYPPALIGLARVVLETSHDVSEAMRLLHHARRINPASLAARVVEARALIDERRYLDAAHALQQALSDRGDHVEARATLAAAYFLADQIEPYRANKARALRLDPRAGTFFRIVAELAARQHRYADAVSLARQALEIDPDDAYARSELGTNLLRLGEEEKGVAQLRRTWEGDRYNERTYRLLDLYEEVIPEQYIFVRSKHFKLRAHKDESALLERTVLPLLERAHAHYARAYRFKPTELITVELYRDRVHYAVRTVGLPRLGVLGVCFGNVITAVSPTQGAFNWAQVLWHELNHVFTLQISRSRVPRWLTEGLADLEPSLVRSEWRRESDFAFFDALRADRLPRLARMNQAFTRSRSVDEMVVAYFQSQLLAAFLLERAGRKGLLDALAAYGAGQATAEIWPRITGLSLEQLDERFRRQQRARLAPYAKGWSSECVHSSDLARLEQAARTAPRQSRTLGELALARLRHGKLAGAERAARRALAIDKHDKPSLYVLGKIALQQNKREHVARWFHTLIAAGGDGYEARLVLGRLALQRADLQAAEKHLGRATSFRPEAAQPHELLAVGYEQRGQLERAVERLKQLVRIEQQRLAPVSHLVSLLAKQGDHAAVREYGQLAYHIQPASSQLHLQLADAYEAAAPEPQMTRAIWHLKTALLCRPRNPDPIRRRVARLVKRARRRERAIKPE